MSDCQKKPHNNLQEILLVHAPNVWVGKNSFRDQVLRGR